MQRTLLSLSSSSSLTTSLFFTFIFYDGFIQRRPIRRRCNASFTVTAIILLSYVYTYTINISSKTIRSFNSRKMIIILYYIVHYYTSRTATSARPQNYVIFIVLIQQLLYSAQRFWKNFKFSFSITRHAVTILGLCTATSRQISSQILNAIQCVHSYITIYYYVLQVLYLRVLYDSTRIQALDH